MIMQHSRIIWIVKLHMGQNSTQVPHELPGYEQALIVYDISVLSSYAQVSL